MRAVTVRGNMKVEENSIGSVQFVETDGGGNGLVIRFGGHGSGYTDNRLDLDAVEGDHVYTAPGVGEEDMSGCKTYPCFKATDRKDLVIAFGAPAEASDEGVSYWRTAVAFPEGVDTIRASDTPTYTGRENLGHYDVWLSNHVGGMGDEASYLTYAAYGLFHYMDNGLHQGWLWDDANSNNQFDDGERTRRLTSVGGPAGCRGSISASTPTATPWTYTLTATRSRARTPAGPMLCSRRTPSCAGRTLRISWTTITRRW